jgi:hypothetical protein
MSCFERIDAIWTHDTIPHATKRSVKPFPDCVTSFEMVSNAFPFPMTPEFEATITMMM